MSHLKYNSLTCPCSPDCCAPVPRLLPGCARACLPKRFCAPPNNLAAATWRDWQLRNGSQVLACRSGLSRIWGCCCWPVVLLAWNVGWVLAADVLGFWGLDHVEDAKIEWKQHQAYDDHEWMFLLLRENNACDRMVTWIPTTQFYFGTWSSESVVCHENTRHTAMLCYAGGTQELWSLL